MVYSCARDFGILLEQFLPPLYFVNLSQFSASEDSLSMYLVCATLPTVFHESFWNFAGFFIMICRFAWVMLG